MRLIGHLLLFLSLWISLLHASPQSNPRPSDELNDRPGDYGDQMSPEGKVVLAVVISAQTLYLVHFFRECTFVC